MGNKPLTKHAHDRCFHTVPRRAFPYARPAKLKRACVAKLTAELSALRWFGYLSIVSLLFGYCADTFAQSDVQANQLGQTDLINMPDARVEPEGVLRFGAGYFDPYTTIWTSVSMFSRLEFTARYTVIDDVEAFNDRPDSDFGDYKDKAFDVKLVLLKESRFFPQVAVGAQDFTGTKVFDANYVVLSKRLGGLDLSLGTGTDRLDGAFGGINYTPSWFKNWTFSAEYDAFDYENDRFASESGADKRAGGMTYAINYHWGWLGAQLAVQDGEIGANAYVAIPLMEPEFIPKFEEPPPYSQKIDQATVQDWEQDKQHALALIKTLEAQDYKNVRVWLHDQQLEVGVAIPRISLIGRAAGHAARTALLMSPVGTQSIKITYYTMQDMVVVSYEFLDLAKLDLFFSGQLTYGELVQVMKISYAEPKYARLLERNNVTVPKEVREI